MALIKPIPSDQTRRALVAGVSDFMDKGDPLANVLLNATLGLRVFTLGLRDIADGAGIEAAKPAGWRFLAGAPMGPAVAGDVTDAQPDKPARMTSLSRDPLIAAAIRATHEIETLPEVHAKNYELQALRIPALLIEAFWLKSQAGETDLIVPVLTRAKQLQVMRAYPMDEFLNIVRPLTGGFLKFDEYRD